MPTGAVFPDLHKSVFLSLPMQSSPFYVEGVQKGKFPFFQKNRKKTAKKAYAGARVRVKKRAFGVYFTKVPKKA